MNKIVSIIKYIFTLDYRSVAFLRIAIALIVLIDLLIRATDITAFYTNDGIYPLDVLFSFDWNPYKQSLHTLNG